jgi:hypothetical protein
MAEFKGPDPIKDESEQSKTFRIKEADLSRAGKPNYFLTVKLNYRGINSSESGGSFIRTRLAELIKANTNPRWRTRNRGSSQFYYARYDGMEDELVANTKTLLRNSVVTVRQQWEERYPQDVGGPFGLSFIITKPLGAAGENHDEAAYGLGALELEDDEKEAQEEEEN